jgi:hypothetical protein
MKEASIDEKRGYSLGHTSGIWDELFHFVNNSFTWEVSGISSEERAYLGINRGSLTKQARVKMFSLDDEFMNGGFEIQQAVTLLKSNLSV